jgi:hypothetical protein
MKLGCVSSPGSFRERVEFGVGAGGEEPHRGAVLADGVEAEVEGDGGAADGFACEDAALGDALHGGGPGVLVERDEGELGAGEALEDSLDVAADAAGGQAADGGELAIGLSLFIDSGDEGALIAREELGAAGDLLGVAAGVSASEVGEAEGRAFVVGAFVGGVCGFVG